MVKSVENVGFGLRASGFGLRASGFGLRASGFGLRASAAGVGFRWQEPARLASVSLWVCCPAVRRTSGGSLPGLPLRR
ncbi:hypothetical protein EHF36_14455 [Kerstersia gyiorum]|nr:hypothetical protein EHF36_14455 [Kerstersia gyiorum]